MKLFISSSQPGQFKFKGLAKPVLLDKNLVEREKDRMPEKPKKKTKRRR